MLQQTTVQAVLPFYERWIRLFPDIPSLARAPLRRVLRAWQGLGYYERARNLRRAAALLVGVHGGRLPESFRGLRKLPGFGPYTTAAVLSIAFLKPEPVLDANVRRVLMRLWSVDDRTGPALDKRLLAGLKSLISTRRPGKFNQALMELGALICRPRNPSCLLCPVLDFCRAADKGSQELIPRPAKRAIRKIEAAVAIIKKDGRYLVQKRPPGGLLGDLWEFPGGKLEPGESPEDALRREIREELGAELQSAEFLTKVEHAYTQFKVGLSVYSCRLAGRYRPDLPDMRWLSLRALHEYPLPSGSVKILAFLERLERRAGA